MTEAGGADDPLTRGRAAWAERAWGDAYVHLQAARATGELDPADLESLAMAAYLTGRPDEFVELLEEAHHAHLREGDPRAAALSAFWLGFALANAGEPGAAGGWFGRAARLLADVEEPCAEQGYLLVPDAHRRLVGGDHEGAYEKAGEATAVGVRFDDRDLFALAVHLQGRARILQRRVEDGLRLLDEAMVAVATDALAPQVAGLVYCSAISACRSVGELGRMYEWTEALARWCDQQPDLVPYRGECLVYRAELLRLRGAWDDALAELERASVRTEESSDRRTAAAAAYARGEVHRLRGERSAAEEAYRNASALGLEPLPGLALLRLAQSDAPAAIGALRRSLAEVDAPLARARLLPALVESAVASGEVEEARQACEELEGIAAEVGTRVLLAQAAEARGAVELAGGNAVAALRPLKEAWEAWTALDAPWEAARVRMLRGRACRALGDEESAALEEDAARAAFEGLGAAPAAPPGGPSRPRARRAEHGLTPRELEVLVEVATGRTNRAIAKQLFISEKTVARHLSNIFAKLDVSSRAAATAFAYDHGIVDPST